MSKKKEFKLFTWTTGILTDYTDGIIVVMAYDIKQALDLLKEQDVYLYQEVLGKDPDHIEDGPTYQFLGGSA